MSNAEFGGGNHVLSLFYGLDLGNDNRCSSIESVANRGVIVARDSVDMLGYIFERWYELILDLPDERHGFTLAHELNLVNNLVCR